MERVSTSVYFAYECWHQFRSILHPLRPVHRRTPVRVAPSRMYVHSAFSFIRTGAKPRRSAILGNGRAARGLWIVIPRYVTHVGCARSIPLSAFVLPYCNTLQRPLSAANRL